MAEGQSGHEATEEDATELQFPKGPGSSSGAGPGPGPGLCRACGAGRGEPWLRCPVCPGRPAVCVSCFSRGAEFPGHRNDHPYAVVGRCCPLGEGWGGGEELALLGAVGECGLGDWEGVSARVGGRGARECRDHYLRCYLTRPPPVLAGLLGERGGTGAGQAGREADPVEYVGDLEQPPRPAPGTPAAGELAGYSAPRGDFEVEWDSGAEGWVSSLDPGLFDGAEEDCPGLALVEALLDGYRWRLAERHGARRAVRNAGLVGVGRAAAGLARLRPSLPRPLWEALPRLSALLAPEEADLLVAGQQVAGELRRHIEQLCEWRRAGLRRHGSVGTYQALLQRRQARRRERQSLVVAGGGAGAAEAGWVVLGPGSSLAAPPVPGGGRRRQRLPLNISGMPGYGSLTEAEAAVASELRLSPEAFLHHKRLLVGECVRGGGSIRLAQARAMLKIDVNKTRRIFDLLRGAGDIHTTEGPGPGQGPGHRRAHRATHRPPTPPTTTTTT